MCASYCTAWIIPKQISKYGIGQLLILCSVYGYYMYTAVMIASCGHRIVLNPTNHLTTNFQFGHELPTSLINQNFNKALT